MSIYLRLVVGPIVVCDIDLFASKDTPKDDDPPPQLAGGQGSMYYPDPPPDPVVFGFTGRLPTTRPGDRPAGEPNPALRKGH